MNGSGRKPESQPRSYSTATITKRTATRPVQSNIYGIVFNIKKLAHFYIQLWLKT